METTVDAQGLEQPPQQQQCEGQKRPETPDHSEEKGLLSTLGGLEDDYREALQSYDGEKSMRSFFVELGVGWTVDPNYAVGKRMSVFCTVEEEWHACTTLSYCEDTGVHEIQFEDGKTVKLPLLGLRVRFLFIGGFSPKIPPFSRKKQIHDVVSKGIESGTYKKGFLPGIRYGLAKLEEAMVHDAYYITEKENQTTSTGDEIDMARALIVGQDAIIAKYRKLYPKYLAMPHWVEDHTFSPGELVWVKFDTYKEWPSLVVSSDQIMEGLEPCRISAKRKYTCVYFLGSYDIIAVESKNVFSYADGLLKGYHRGLPKKHKNSYILGLEESKLYAKVRLYFMTFYMIVYDDMVIFVARSHC